MVASDTEQDRPEAGPSSSANPPPLQPEGWEDQAVALAATLSEALGSSLDHEASLEVGSTQTIAGSALSDAAPAPYLVIGLSLTGTHAGTVAVVLPEIVAIALADRTLGAEAPENPSGQLDEARGQALESLFATLAPTAASHISEASGETADLVVSDRDRFESGDQLQAYLAPEGGEHGFLHSTVALRVDGTRLGDTHILIPAAVLQDLPDEPLDDEPWKEAQADASDQAASTPKTADEEAAPEDATKQAQQTPDEEPSEEPPANQDDAATEDESAETTTAQSDQAPESSETAASESGGEDEEEERTGVLRPEEMAALIGDEEDEGSGEDAAESAPQEADDSQGDASGGEEKAEDDDVPEEAAVNMHAVHTTLLQASYHIDEELKAFFGEPLELYDYVGRVVSKQELLKRFSGKIVVTNMAITGDAYGEAFTAVTLDDAIFLGATLIMLPIEEINRKIRNAHFREDESDAFGEVINIFAGAYSTAFGDYFPKKVRLKKDRMTTVAPTKVDIASEEPFPDGDYFLASYSMRLGSRALQEFHIFFPPKLLGITKKNAAELREKPVAATQDSSGKQCGTTCGKNSGPTISRACFWS